MTRPCTIVYLLQRGVSLSACSLCGFCHDSIQPFIFCWSIDGSTDNTLGVLRKAGAGREDQVGVIDQPVNGGKGEAVRAGVLAALKREGCLYVGFWNADMATPLELIDALAVSICQSAGSGSGFRSTHQTSRSASGASCHTPLSGPEFRYGCIRGAPSGHLRYTVRGQDIPGHQ